MRTVLLVAAALLAVACCFLSLQVCDAACPSGTPLASGDEINVAVQVWLINKPAGLYTGDLSDAEAWTSGYGYSIVQPSQLAWDLYIKEMRRLAAQNGTNLRMSNGVWVKVNYYYVNIAHVSGTHCCSGSLILRCAKVMLTID
jgi:hypothetical protein